MGGSIELDSGLFLLRTRLGFVLTGKQEIFGFVVTRSEILPIEKAFLQLGIAPKHRDFLKFFHPDEGEEIVYRLCRVVFGVSSSPFLLAAVLTHLLENVPAEDSQLGSKLKLSFYVDNCVTGVNDVAQQEKLVLKSREILSRGCFNLRNWESNVESKHISKSTGTMKLLGIIWDLDKDTLKCKIDFESLSVESHWWEGPLWLVEPPDTWPLTKLPNYDTSEISLERRKVRLCNLNLSEEKLPWYARKFSKFHSILRLVACVLRFINNVRCRIGDGEKGQLSLDEIESAEIQLIRSVQAQCFVDEKLISNLCVFRDHNIIRVKTRITERIDTSLFLSPILLPNNCIFTQRLVEHFHLKNHHAGTQLLLSIIREKYWIVGGRRTVRKIWNACVKFRRFKSKSPMTDPVSLPADRVKDAAVFEVELTPITPAMFLFEIQTAKTKDLEIRDANHFCKRVRFRAKVIEELKKRFRNEYLGQLIQRQKQHPQSSNICEGDIVLIGDDWKKRLQWPLARVIKLIPGKDGLVRTVKLRTQSCTLIRPMQRVFPLEVSGNSVTSLPLQKVQQIDLSMNCAEPDTLKASVKPQVTRCGRPVKKPEQTELVDFN
ncbi:integrase catalytic domain-containing protein [Trichonephila clavata]|uniref:Integrase catalytic domain-containing protein n=1 Tax=Trichonephila clavata TaxID=2740835 RepID=A0A8X6G8F6_TRICU|nr:integrase catalytic domain-containing protein [Trichonephila clavata]